jgi:hypothetical protein
VTDLAARRRARRGRDPRRRFCNDHCNSLAMSMFISY